MADLGVIDITLGPPETREPTGLFNYEPGEEPRFIDVAIRIRNTSDHSLYVISSVRQLQYDSAGRLLTVALNESGPPEAPGFTITHQVILPTFILLPPGVTETVRVSVPQVIHRLTSFDAAGDGLQEELLDISGLERIRCNIAFNDTPFEPEAGASPQAVLRQLSSWGDSVEKTVRPKRPGK